MSRSIESYDPMLPPAVKEQVMAFVRAAVQDSESKTTVSARKRLSCLTRLAAWTWTIGLPLEREAVLHRKVIAQFANEGCRDMKQGSRATYRSTLFSIADALLDQPHRFDPIPGLGKGDASEPYDDRQIPDIQSWAASQGTEARRVNATMLLCLGFGAGLAAREIGLVTAADVTVDDQGVLLQVSGDRPRLVPVLAEWEAPLAALAQSAIRKDQWLFRPQRHSATSPNIVSSFVESSTTPPFPITAQRLRATWLVRHLAAGTPIHLLAKVAGLEKPDGLNRFVEYVPDVAVRDVRDRLRRCITFGTDEGPAS